MRQQLDRTNAVSVLVATDMAMRRPDRFRVNQSVSVVGGRRGAFGLGQVAGVLLATVVCLGGCSQALETGGLGAMLTPASGSSDIATGSVGGAGQSGDQKAKLDVARARALQEDGKGGRALTTLAQAHLKAPKNEEVLIAYGRTAVEEGQGKLAYDVISNADPALRNSSRLLSVKGAALAMIGRHEDAHKAFADALVSSPNDPDLLNNLAMSHALKGEVGDAERLLRKAAGSTQNKKVHQNLALVLGLQGRFSEGPVGAAASGAKVPGGAWNARTTQTMLGGPGAAAQ